MNETIGGKGKSNDKRRMFKIINRMKLIIKKEALDKIKKDKDKKKKKESFMIIRLVLLYSSYNIDKVILKRDVKLYKDNVKLVSVDVKKIDNEKIKDFNKIIDKKIESKVNNNINKNKELSKKVIKTIGPIVDIVGDSIKIDSKKNVVHKNRKNIKKNVKKVNNDVKINIDIIKKLPVRDNSNRFIVKNKVDIKKDINKKNKDNINKINVIKKIDNNNKKDDSKKDDSKKDNNKIDISKKIVKTIGPIVDIVGDNIRINSKNNSDVLDKLDINKKIELENIKRDEVLKIKKNRLEEERLAKRIDNYNKLSKESKSITCDSKDVIDINRKINEVNKSIDNNKKNITKDIKNIDKNLIIELIKEDNKNIDNNKKFIEDKREDINKKEDVDKKIVDDFDIVRIWHMDDTKADMYEYQQYIKYVDKFQKFQESIYKDLDNKVKNAVSNKEYITKKYIGMNDQLKALLAYATINAAIPKKNSLTRLIVSTGYYLYAFHLLIHPKFEESKKSISSIKDYSFDIKSSISNLDTMNYNLNKNREEISKIKDDLKRNYSDMSETSKIIKNLEELDKKLVDKASEIKSIKKKEEILLEKNNAKVKEIRQIR